MTPGELKLRLAKAIAHMESISEPDPHDVIEHITEPWCDECKQVLATMKLVERAIRNAE